MIEHIASISYGKDSLAMLEIIKQHNLPLDRIVHVEIMATNTIPADLPPMMKFKKKADIIIKERYGIEVEHIHAKVNYEEQFYKVRHGRINDGVIYGFPLIRHSWCNSVLKTAPLKKLERSGAIMYIGIAADEPNRFHNLTEKKRSPLVEYGITENECRQICCERTGLLSPIYTQSARGGCWFCHNQGIQQLRLLRKQYPKYWALMLKWDSDSPLTFHADGHTVHDFDRRFQAEDDGLVYPNERFRWSMLDEPLNYRLF